MVAELSSLMGLGEIVDAIKLQSQQGIERQVAPIVSDFRRSGASVASQRELTAAIKHATATIAASWNSSEATNIYMNALAATLTNDDLKSAIRFYKSAEGKRAAGAAASAAQQMGTYVNSRIDASMPLVLEKLRQDIRAISERHKASAGAARQEAP